MAPTTPFTIPVSPKTDLWRKPPSTNSINAPIISITKMPLSQFRSARVSFRASWKYRYDQGGLALFLTAPSWAKNKWVKAGVEFYQDRAQMSAVTTDGWSDWSLAPLKDGEGTDGVVTVEARAEGDELGRGSAAERVRMVLCGDGRGGDRNCGCGCEAGRR
ncbi:hypothetical protein PENSPDRAFT_647555 [Peniophora sp. CONT]|nr:hypothetical protein PENSPDRAFT_647555 [Peniophora sp. CONT]